LIYRFFVRIPLFFLLSLAEFDIVEHQSLAHYGYSFVSTMVYALKALCYGDGGTAMVLGGLGTSIHVLIGDIDLED
jgi:hypothetical protein